MSTVGIIAEYNPLTPGHRYHIAEAKRLTGCERAVIVLSGSFVQRGEPALFSEEVRTRSALSAGADLVLELPFIGSCTSAEGFAAAGVRLLAGTGLVDVICCGAEHPNAPVHSFTAEELEAALQRELFTGCAYATAERRAVNSLCGYEEGPNDLLARLYSHEAEQYGIPVLRIQRMGEGYGSEALNGDLPSATAVRNHIRRYAALPEAFADEYAAEAVQSGEYTLCEPFIRIAFERLRICEPDVLQGLLCDGAGLADRLCNAAREAADGASFMEKLRTRRYPEARLRRALAHLLLGVPESTLLTPDNAYIRVLGVREASMLSELVSEAVLPLVLRYGDRTKLNSAGAAVFQAEERAGRLWRLCCVNVADRAVQPPSAIIHF